VSSQVTRGAKTFRTDLAPVDLELLVDNLGVVDQVSVSAEVSRANLADEGFFVNRLDVFVQIIPRSRTML
jgi:hypothetical protein